MEERIGDYLVRVGALTQDQVGKILDAQKTGGAQRRFGEVAVELGFISAGDFEKHMKAKGS